MNIFEAAAAVEKHIVETMPVNTVNQTGVISINSRGQILNFKSLTQAINLVNNSGWIFSYTYINGHVKLLPEA